MLPVIITARGTMLPDIIGVLTGIVITGAPTGSTGIGGIAAGTGIEVVITDGVKSIFPQDQPDRWQ